MKAARLAALQALLGRQARAFNASKVGATVPVLFAEAGRKPGQLIGKTPWLQSVYAEGNARLIGRIVDVRLIDGHANSLAGEIVTRPGGRRVSDPAAGVGGRTCAACVRRQRAAGRCSMAITTVTSCASSSSPMCS